MPVEVAEKPVHQEQKVELALIWNSVYRNTVAKEHAGQDRQSCPGYDSYEERADS